jgi:hypothetical protein
MNVRPAIEPQLSVNLKPPQFVVANRCRKCLGKSAFNRHTQSMQGPWNMMMPVMKGGKASKYVIIEEVFM